MDPKISRRTFLASVAVPGAIGVVPEAADAKPHNSCGWISGKMTGAQAVVVALQAEGTGCVYGIPGAQENELWDVFKQKGLPYLLVAHEFSASTMADGYARSTGQPGVLCIVPGPGITNALSGIGEALLDSIPLVCIVGDVARGETYRAFQVHDLPNARLLEPVTKQVLEVRDVCEIPLAVRQAFVSAKTGEPGPVAVVIPYDLLIESHQYSCPPPAPVELPFDESAVRCAIDMLADCKQHVGIFAGLGCMDHAVALRCAAELLQAPVATTVSGKGVIDERHPLAVGWGYGKHGTLAAEKTFKSVDIVLAIGARFSELATAFYSLPKRAKLIHIDVSEHNLGKVMPTDVCVHADAGLFLDALQAERGRLCRPANDKLVQQIERLKEQERRTNAKLHGKCAADPMAFLYCLRQIANDDALLFVDVTVVEHWAAQVYETRMARTYFNPTDNQAMGWSIPAAIGAQSVHAGRQTITVTGDGCFLMSGLEISTAVRECLPVKFFVLDDHAYNYMQRLQESAYGRTTATVLARIDYPAFAQAMGIAYNEIRSTGEIKSGIESALYQDGPVLTRVAVDHGERPVRWIDAVRDRYVNELSTSQKVRFLARLGTRSLDPTPNSD